MSEKLKVAIIGCGARGKLSFGAMLKEREDCEVTALHDTNKVRLKHLSDYLGGRTYTNLDEMLDKEELDCAIITTPDAEHERCAVKALDHGVNVLIDKPLAT
ncbi:MAG: Gfo/Idh/MocA family oxidoreductase, partial [Lentisphaeria bacterium]|nr:Gfo/Idh/MocA family oxidoreductase [Lentisphaeria bacterium]